MIKCCECTRLREDCDPVYCKVHNYSMFKKAIRVPAPIEVIEKKGKRIKVREIIK